MSRVSRWVSGSVAAALVLAGIAPTAASATDDTAKGAGAVPTVGSPGAADAALTVGAVNDSDELADFSSRGPRADDYAIKPEITAPGEGIVAARAAGTSMGSPVSEDYTRASGTSMAAPHVAGAAAILAQQHPGWGPQRLKAALTSTAATQDGYTVYQQGAGRVDVARATSQQVYVSAGHLDLGFFRWPHTDAEPTVKTVTYTNASEADVTLELSLEVRGEQGSPAPGDMFSLGTRKVTIAPGTSEEVRITLGSELGEPGSYGGYLVATSASGVRSTTAVGAYKEPEMYDVTVHGVARDGRPAASSSYAQLWNLGTDVSRSADIGFSGGSATFRVPPDTYNLTGFLYTVKESGERTEMSVAARPELEVKGNVEITLDARRAERIEIGTPKPSTHQWLTLGYHRTGGGHERTYTHQLGEDIQRVYATPTEAATEGEFEFYTRWRLVKPDVEVSPYVYTFSCRRTGEFPGTCPTTSTPRIWLASPTPSTVIVRAKGPARCATDGARTPISPPRTSST